MLMTETEAGGKWCPMARHDNRNKVRDLIALGAECVGSHCAMWRWSDEVRRKFHHAHDRNAITEPVRPALLSKDWIFVPCEDYPAGWLEPEATALARRRGRCGLAGGAEVS
jgi:hypothetical protein